MNDAPIITSLLEQDFYKFTMGQLVLHQLPTVDVRAEFRLRTPGVDLRPYIPAIREQLDHLCSLRFTDDEIGYLRGKRAPTVERGNVDFDELGISWRVYFDVGVREQDTRGMVFAKGAN